VSWAKLWEKAKENRARNKRIVRRGKIFMIGFMIGAIFTGAGGYNLYSDVRHQIHGKPATATLMEHIKQCTVEYQRISEQKRTETWPCDQAEEFQRLVGRDRIEISRQFIARVQFPLTDGRTHEASVDDIKLGSYGLVVGATLPVVYAPDNPADVRAAMSWESLKVPLGLFAVGIVCLALAFRGSLAAVFGWAFRRRTSRAGEATASAPSKHLA
jgi:hypothetical protein